MSTMREHIHDLHKREAQHHAAKATHHSAVAGHYQTLASHLGKTAVTENQKDSSGVLEALAGLHEKLAGEHTDMAAHHHEQAEACAKGADTGDLTKLVPSSVSAVAPPRSVTMVPRAGGPGVPQVREVDSRFSKLTIVEEGEEPSLRQ